MYQQTDPNSFLTATNAVPPADSAAATINGTAHSRIGRNGAILHHACGAASGTPTSFTVATKVQDAADDGAGAPDAATWADLKDPATLTTVQAATTLTEDNTEAKTSVDLTLARPWVRAVTTVAFVDGTTPKVEVCATFVFTETIIPRE